jgi:NitT/TauT family transport system substrate-binding protein
MPLPAAAAPARRDAYRTIATLAAALAVTVAGCGTRPAPAGPGGPEQSSLVVAAVPGEGSAGLYIAQDQGLFTRAGLHVTIEPVTSSSVVIPAMLHGRVQVAAGQYTTYIAATAAGVAAMRILAAGYSLGPHVQDIMIGPRSKIATLTQLRGATVAVNALNGETTDLLYTTLAAYRITPAQVRVVAMPFPAMPAALAAHKVTAIYEIEPYTTEASEHYGDEDLADIDTGAAQDFPIAGYAALASWAARHPATAAAFTRAIEQGNALATTNPAVLERALETSLHLSAQVVDVMATGNFPTATDPVQLQRVAAMMLRYGQLSRPFAVTALTGR